MADPILESSFKNQIKILFIVTCFSPLNKKVEKFQPCLKTAASLFPFSWLTFLITAVKSFIGSPADDVL